MKVWMVRAGADGQRERQALENEVLLPGWTDINSDLSQFNSASQIRRQLRIIHGESKSLRALGSWAGQMWRFVNDVAEGDIVVMPLKHDRGKMAIGRISGPYRYSSEAAVGEQHQRPVEWASDLILKENLGLDLQASLGALLTICEISRNDAAARLGNVLSNGVDPNYSYADDFSTEAYLADIVERVENNEKPESTIRDLLARWGFYRRTSNTVETVVAGLNEYGLLTVPSITEGGINDSVIFVADADHERFASSGIDTQELSSVTEEQIYTAKQASEFVSFGEVRYAVGSLPSANRDVESVGAKTPLPEALTTMAIKSYSQLAVTDHQNRLMGAVTWESVAMAWASGTPQVVRDVMVEAQSVATSEELLSLTRRISDHGYVFVRDADGRVQGIVTAADLTQKFGDDQTPHVQLDEIEGRLGAHVRDCCSDDDLTKHGVRVPRSGKTLGTYVYALAQEELWNKLGWHGVDQKAIYQLMERVRKIRNDVMHFSPDPITSEELEVLASAMRTLRLITDDTKGS